MHFPPAAGGETIFGRASRGLAGEGTEKGAGSGGGRAGGAGGARRRHRRLVPRRRGQRRWRWPQMRRRRRRRPCRRWWGGSHWLWEVVVGIAASVEKVVPYLFAARLYEVRPGTPFGTVGERTEVPSELERRRREWRLSRRRRWRQSWIRWRRRAWQRAGRWQRGGGSGSRGGRLRSGGGVGIVGGRCSARTARRWRRHCGDGGGDLRSGQQALAATKARGFSHVL